MAKPFLAAFRLTRKSVAAEVPAWLDTASKIEPVHGFNALAAQSRRKYHSPE